MKKFSILLLLFAKVSFGQQSNEIVKEKFHYGTVTQDTSAGYAGVVKIDNVLYLSGVTSGGDFATQVANIYKRIEINLKRYGATFQNVVKENLYTLSIDSMKKYNYIRKPFYKEDFPAATWVQVSQLFVPDRMLEVEVIAHLPKQQELTIATDLFEGKWVMQKGNRTIGEEWLKASDGILHNKGYFIKGTDTIITERVTLQKMNGEFYYTSTVEDQNDKKPVSFKLTGVEGKAYTFENPAHDFPKRIVYDFSTPDSLHAYIDDGVDEKKRQNFYYKKVK